MATTGPGICSRAAAHAQLPKAQGQQQRTFSSASGSSQAPPVEPKFTIIDLNHVAAGREPGGGTLTSKARQAELAVIQLDAIADVAGGLEFEITSNDSTSQGTSQDELYDLFSRLSKAADIVTPAEALSFAALWEATSGTESVLKVLDPAVEASTSEALSKLRDAGILRHCRNGILRKLMHPDSRPNAAKVSADLEAKAEAHRIRQAERAKAQRIREQEEAKAQLARDLPSARFLGRIDQSILVVDAKLAPELYKRFTKLGGEAIDGMASAHEAALHLAASAVFAKAVATAHAEGVPIARDGSGTAVKPVAAALCQSGSRGRTLSDIMYHNSAIFEYQAGHDPGRMTGNKGCFSGMRGCGKTTAAEMLGYAQAVAAWVLNSIEAHTVILCRPVVVNSYSARLKGRDGVAFDSSGNNEAETVADIGPSVQEPWEPWEADLLYDPRISLLRGLQELDVIEKAEDFGEMWSVALRNIFGTRSSPWRTLDELGATLSKKNTTVLFVIDEMQDFMTLDSYPTFFNSMSDLIAGPQRIGLLCTGSATVLPQLIRGPRGELEMLQTTSFAGVAPILRDMNDSKLKSIGGLHEPLVKDIRRFLEVDARLQLSRLEKFVKANIDDITSVLTKLKVSNPRLILNHVAAAAVGASTHESSVEQRLVRAVDAEWLRSYRAVPTTGLDDLTALFQGVADDIRDRMRAAAPCPTDWTYESISEVMPEFWDVKEFAEARLAKRVSPGNPAASSALHGRLTEWADLGVIAITTDAGGRLKLAAGAWVPRAVMHVKFGQMDPELVYALAEPASRSPTYEMIVAREVAQHGLQTLAEAAVMCAREKGFDSDNPSTVLAKLGIIGDIGKLSDVKPAFEAVPEVLGKSLPVVKMFSKRPKTGAQTGSQPFPLILSDFDMKAGTIYRIEGDLGKTDAIYVVGYKHDGEQRALIIPMQFKGMLPMSSDRPYNRIEAENVTQFMHGTFDSTCTYEGEEMTAARMIVLKTIGNVDEDKITVAALFMTARPSPGANSTNKQCLGFTDYGVAINGRHNRVGIFADNSVMDEIKTPTFGVAQGMAGVSDKRG